MDDINNSNFQTGGICNTYYPPISPDCCGCGPATTNSSFSASDLLALVKAFSETSNYPKPSYSACLENRTREFYEVMSKAWEKILTPAPIPFKKQIDENPELENEFKSLIFEEGKSDNDADQSI